jgi:hypothetical protein
LEQIIKSVSKSNEGDPLTLAGTIFADTIFAVSAWPIIVCDATNDVDDVANNASSADDDDDLAAMDDDDGDAGNAVPGPDAQVGRFEKIGYDGESGVDYEKGHLSILSPLVWKDITERGRAEILFAVSPRFRDRNEPTSGDGAVAGVSDDLRGGPKSKSILVAIPP